MNLYCAKLADVQPRHWELISEKRRQRAERYKMPDDRKRCVAGGLLLRRYLPHAVITDNGFGKPVAAGVGFNLSHSGEWIVLAVSDTDVGVDIERLRILRWEGMGKVVYTENEMALLRRSADKMGAFFALWTKKEALLKCMGEGFHRAAQSVDVSGDHFADGGRVYRLRTLSFADYTLSVCADRDFKADITFVDLKTMI